MRARSFDSSETVRGLSGKLVLVTGAGGGIGQAICRRFAEEGCDVATLDINATSARASAAIVEAHGRRAHPIEVDIADYDAVAGAVDELESHAGPVEILVNNAGADRFANFLDTKPSEWDPIIDVNLKGPLNMQHVVLTRMRGRNSGRVVNIASDAGRVGSSMEAVYSACKGGVIVLTKSLARELARTGIRINAVCPGPTDTPLLMQLADSSEAGRKVRAALERAIPLKRIGRPDDIPGVVAFLASDDAEYITGQVISVSGGLTMHG